MVYPWKKIKISLLITERIGHLSTNTDLFMRRKQLNKNSDDIFYIFFAGNPCNRQLLEMWKRYILIIENQLIYDLFRFSENLLLKSKYYDPLSTLFNEYNIYQKTKSTLTFTSEEYFRGYNFLKEIGIDLKKNWYVCIFARDSKYLNTVYNKGNWSYHDYRNADINKFQKVSKYISDIGGFVVRIGSHVSKPFLLNNEKVIDYASNFRTDFMDIFIIAHCKFVIGNTSGICDVAMAFDIPYLGTNIVPIGNVPHGKKSLFIPKKIYTEMGERVSYFKLISENTNRNSSLWMTQWWIDQGYVLVENTQEEILEVTKEMLMKLNDEYHLTKEELMMMKNYFELYSETHWAKEIKTPIGLDFLKNNLSFFQNYNKI